MATIRKRRRKGGSFSYLVQIRIGQASIRAAQLPDSFFPEDLVIWSREVVDRVLTEHLGGILKPNGRFSLSARSGWALLHAQR